MANIKKKIDKSQIAIKDVMQTNLAVIAQSIIDQIMAKAKKATPSTMLNSTKSVTPKGQANYKSELKATLAVISLEALGQARKEVPKAKNVKLMENEERLLFGEFVNLPPKIRNRITTANQLLIGTQIADLEKALFFQFNSSATSEKPIKEIESDLNESAEKYILGAPVTAGSAVVATTTVNDARNAFFFEDDVLEEIEAFQFMNDSPVSPICQSLAGQYFPKNDPNAFRYTPPLHYNAILEGELVKTENGNIPIEDIKIGDMVLTHENKYQRVYETMNKFEDKEYFDLELENGLTISLTGEHPLLTSNRGWIRTDEILLTDNVVCFEDLDNGYSIGQKPLINP